MSDYQPGVCNIGRVEIARRKRVGWIGVVATVVLSLVLVLFHVSAVWRLLLFVTAIFAAIGFLQAYMRFCAGFGFRGVFNFEHQVGRTKTIEEEEFRRRDRKKALQIVAYSILIAILVVTIAFFSPF